MSKLVLAAIAASIFVVQPAASSGFSENERHLYVASSDDVRTDQVPQGQRIPLEEIRAQLEAQVYEIQRLKHDDHYVEAYAKKDGRRWELKISPTDGRILKIEAED